MKGGWIISACLEVPHYKPRLKVTLSIESDSNKLLKSILKNQLKFKKLTHQCSPLFECNVTELTLKGWSLKLSVSDASFCFFWTIYVSPIII